MAINVIVFSQNVKISSFDKKKSEIDCSNKILMLTSHRLLLNERLYLESIFPQIEYISFGELLSDKENEIIDKTSINDSPSVTQYYRKIMIRKNELIYEKIVEKYGKIDKGYVCCADLGIYRLFWLNKGFSLLEMDYYHKKDELKSDEFWVSDYNGKKLIFLGKLSRVGYRMELTWKHSADDYTNYLKGVYLTKDKCQYLTTIHEAGKVRIPDNEMYDVRYIQDGYLPPNYSSLYMRYKPNNVSYYAWDTMSKEAFDNADVKADIMPFRRILFLPSTSINRKLKRILVATSGPGDWTAQKNRSDEDFAIEIFAELAKRNPDIQIIYRCHPTWPNPEHNGVNSINRIKEYIEYLGIQNIHLSQKMPKEEMSSNALSFERSSMDQELEGIDLVMGEHSISMIDGGLKGIPFASYNFSNRRNLFEGINRFGFPYCQNIEDIQKLIERYGTKEFEKEYNDAIDGYNRMLKEER